ncbi:GDSL-type esterase/lipase family protein [Aliiglaciecola aliphaticivorans]
MKKEIHIADPRFAVMRRTLRSDSTLVFSYPGVSVNFNVAAKSVQLIAHSLLGKGRIDVEINHKLAKILVLSATPKTFQLFNANHIKDCTIKLINRGESWHGNIQLKALHINQGELLAAPILPSRKLIFIGDSITSGALMERPARGENARKGPHLSNANQSFGMHIGRMLDAQVHLIGYGGRGLLQGSHTLADNPQLPEIFPLTIPSHTHSWPMNSYIPDGIFICLGTNDFYSDIPDIDLFKQRYQEWIQHLFALYPNVQMMISEGPMLCNSAENKVKKRILIQCLETIVKQLNHPHLHYLPCIDCEGDEFDPHPSRAQHLSMATHLSPMFKDVLKW